jgi:hypothetical protein
MLLIFCLMSFFIPFCKLPIFHIWFYSLKQKNNIFRWGTCVPCLPTHLNAEWLFSS